MAKLSNAILFRRLLLSSAGALVAATPAMAQDAAPAATAPAAVVAETPDQTAATGNEIVVTARNRAERLQDVPLSITAFSSQQLQNANVRNLRDVSFLTPGLSVNSGGSEFGVNPIIRGQTNLNEGGDPNVAVFIDGVYISNKTATNLGLMDVDRIEVVKGPVSSLYGRNAFAGAINYVSKKPSTTKASGKVTAFVGNDGQRSVMGSISYPLVPGVLGVRVAAGYEHFGGSYKDEVNGNRAGGFKKRDIQGAVRFTPSSSLTIDGSYYYGDDKFGPAAIAYNQLNCGRQVTPAPVTDPSRTGYANGTSGTGFCGHFDPDAHAVEVPNVPSLSGASGNSRKVNLASLSMVYDLGIGKLTSLTGYTKIDQQRFTDFIGRRNGIPFALSPVPAAPASPTINLLELFGSNTNNRDFSEEVRFQSRPDRPLRFEFGGFYFKGRTESKTIIGIDGTPIPAGSTITGGFGQAIDYVTVGGAISQTRITQALTHDRQYSGFVGAEYDVAPGLTIRGEYRHTDQKKDQIIIRTTGCPSYRTVSAAPCQGTGTNPPTPYLYPNGNTPISATFKFDNYRASVKYQVSRAINVYASVANGTKAGGFNQRAVALVVNGVTTQPDLSYNPETNKTYEIGLKTSLLDNRLQFNVAAYHIDTKGIQVSGPSSVPTNAGLVTKNFGSVHTDGFEAELAAKLAPGVRVNAGVGYSNPKFGKDSFDFGSAAGCLSIPACSARVVTLLANSQYNSTNANKTALSLSGLSLPKTPHLQLTGGIDLNGPITDGWNWNATYNARYESRFYSFNNNISWAGPRTIMNIRAGVSNATYSASLYVNNLTNDHTPETVSNNARLNDFNADQDGYLPIGRQFGLILGAKF